MRSNGAARSYDIISTFTCSKPGFALINDGNASDKIAVGCSPTVIPQCAVYIATEQFYNPTHTSTSIKAYSENAKFRKRPNLKNPARICCLHDLNRIRNTAIFRIIAEY